MAVRGYIRAKKAGTPKGYRLPEPLAGLEPATHALRMRCSTNWAIVAVAPRGSIRPLFLRSGCKGTAFFWHDQIFNKKKHFYPAFFRKKTLFHPHTISFPNGKQLPKANLKCCIPKGIPTMVMQQIKPNTRCMSAISHQPQSIHTTFMMVDKQLVSPAESRNSCPNGQRANVPNLQSCTPKGMPIIVMHNIKPANQYRSATKIPPKSSQKIFPINFIIQIS